MNDPDYLRCDACQKPVAEVRGTTFRILARHNSRWHLTVMTLVEMEAIVERMRRGASHVDIALSDTACDNHS
ncbi:MAG TPA: hypothetical protein DEU95_06255 [Chloroflexi bacterium]|jgi:hypothetical protein|nr:hypothetical protein [Chloroflexota bacterium]